MQQSADQAEVNVCLGRMLKNSVNSVCVKVFKVGDGDQREISRSRLRPTWYAWPCQYLYLYFNCHGM